LNASEQSFENLSIYVVAGSEIVTGFLRVSSQSRHTQSPVRNTES